MRITRSGSSRSSTMGSITRKRWPSAVTAYCSVWVEGADPHLRALWRPQVHRDLAAVGRYSELRNRLRCHGALGSVIVMRTTRDASGSVDQPDRTANTASVATTLRRRRGRPTSASDGASAPRPRAALPRRSRKKPTRRLRSRTPDRVRNRSADQVSSPFTAGRHVAAPPESSSRQRRAAAGHL